MSRDDLLDDLAYARALAEEGRHAPLIGGLIEGLWRGAVGFVWIGFAALSSIGVFVLRARVGAKPGGSAMANRVDARVWEGVAITIAVLAVSILTRAVLSGDFTLAGAIMASGFGLYGVPLFVTACISDQRWLRSIAVLSWITSAALWFFLAEPWAYLIASAACLVVLVGPGIVLMRREPAAIV